MGKYLLSKNLCERDPRNAYAPRGIKDIPPPILRNITRGAYHSYQAGSPAIDVRSASSEVLKKELLNRQRQQQYQPAPYSLKEPTPATPMRGGSPVEGDLEAYFQWLKDTKKFSEREYPKLDDAYSKLEEGCYTTEMIQSW